MQSSYIKTLSPLIKLNGAIVWAAVSSYDRKSYSFIYFEIMQSFDTEEIPTILAKIKKILKG